MPSARRLSRTHHMALVSAAFLAASSLACGTTGEDEPAPPPAPTTQEPTKQPATGSTPAPATPTSAPTPGLADPAGFDPRVTGSRALARFRGGDFYYECVTTGIGLGSNPAVVYADGAVETLAVDALVPDSLGVGSRVEARIQQWPRFFPGRIERRVGHAVFIHFDDGDERWTSVGLVRAAVAGFSREAPAPPIPPSTVEIPEVGAPVLANFQQAGWFYPAIIAEARGGGVELHVIYADGDSEWLPRGALRPDTLEGGTQVNAQSAAQGGQPIDATIARRVAHAVELELEDGSKRWVALAMVRVR